MGQGKGAANCCEGARAIAAVSTPGTSEPSRAAVRPVTLDTYQFAIRQAAPYKRDASNEEAPSREPEIASYRINTKK
jgi:hypothetical protein